VFPQFGFENKHATVPPTLYLALDSAGMFVSNGAVQDWQSGGANGGFSSFSLTSLPLSEIIQGMVAKKNPNAVALGKLGGVARASNLSNAERSAIAKKAAAARNAKLSTAERSRIAKLAVQARERKRKAKGEIV
jgi:hypothetical protein